MPLPAPIVAAGITAGASLLGTGASAYAQGRMNRATRRWNEKMYRVQREDALADWNMVNLYNSPREMMKRYEEAGLNKALIYGQSNDAGPVRSSNLESWKPEAPRLDFGQAASSGLAAYMDVKFKEAQIDNLKAQNLVVAQDALLRAMQVVATGASTDKTRADTESTQFDTALKKMIQPMSLEAAKLSVEKAQQEIVKSKQDMQLSLRADERAAAITASNIREAVERVLSIRLQRANTEAEKREIEQRIKNLEKDAELKQIEKNMREEGVSWGDPAWLRLINNWLGGIKKWRDREWPKDEKKPEMEFDYFDY